MENFSRKAHCVALKLRIHRDFRQDLLVDHCWSLKLIDSTELDAIELFVEVSSKCLPTWWDQVRNLEPNSIETLRGLRKWNGFLIGSFLTVQLPHRTWREKLGAP